MFGVFDGHGSEGHKISNYVKTHLPKLMNKKYERVRKIEQRFSIIPTASLKPHEKAQSHTTKSTRKLKGAESWNDLHPAPPDVSFKQMRDLMSESIHETDESLGTNAKFSGTTCCSVSILGDRLL